MSAAFPLPLVFDPAQLQADLQQVQPEEWLSHYRNAEYEGEWAIAPLRSVAGHPAVIHAVPVSNLFKNTPLLDRCAYFEQVLEQFQCPIGAVRLMRLGAGARILEHSDDMGDTANREVRLHIPIQTNEQVYFWVNHERVPMQNGALWYANFGLPHSVENKSNEARIHLVLDCQLNTWLKNLLITGQITQFLNKIGIATNFGPLAQETFLPGIAICDGALKIDLEQLKYPGDLLHEAGHIAVTPAEQRPHLNDNVTGEDDPQQAMGQEIAAIGWSYAALKAIGLTTDTVFHADGYKGSSDWYIENFNASNYIGLPLLKWMGLTDTAYPAMNRWLR